MKILGKPAFDKTADKLMSCNTEHIFKEARDYIKKILPNKGDNGWLTHDDADKSIKELYDIVEDAFLALNKLSPEERNFADSEWRGESRENAKLQEEIRPLYELFKGYLKTYQRTLDHSIDCFNTHAIIIPCKRDDIPLKQRYAVQLFPSHSTLEEKRIPSRIKFCGNSEQYDGCIEFSDGVQQKIEVTVANKGKEHGDLKADMRLNGYAMHPMNDEYKMVLKCLDAIKNKLNNEKHRDNKYAECGLMVVLNGWQFESIEDLESFLHFFKKVLEKEKYTIDWTQIKSIIFYPGN